MNHWLVTMNWSKWLTICLFLFRLLKNRQNLETSEKVTGPPAQAENEVSPEGLHPHSNTIKCDFKNTLSACSFAI